MPFEYRCKSCGKSFTLETRPPRAFCPYCGGESEAASGGPSDLDGIIARLRAVYAEYTEKKFVNAERVSVLGGLMSIFTGKKPGQELDTGLFESVKGVVEELVPLAERSGDNGAAAAAEAAHIIVDPSDRKDPREGLMLIACEQLAEPLLPLLTETELRMFADEYGSRFARKSGSYPFPVQEKLLNAMREELARR